MAQKLSAKPAKSKESFSCVAPNAQTVLLAGDFTEWEPVEMKKQKNGTWKTTVSLEPGAHEYRFVVDGVWQNDEACAKRRANGFGVENCIREVQ